ncbi:MAG: hypothetical protein IJV96_02725 [Clostridia bacterium]|nr:hypothetical protein [Clostridia bacterium]
MKKNFSIAYESKENYPEARRQFACAVASGFSCACFSLVGGTLRPDALVACRHEGLRAEALRLPVEGVNLLWSRSVKAPALEGALPSDSPVIDDSVWQTLRGLFGSYFSFAKEIGIDTVIITPAVGYASLPPVAQEALDRFETLASDAERLGVRILFENDESEQHYEAVIRTCCYNGYHGVSFHPAKAWRYFGTSAAAPYVADNLVRVELDDGRDGVFGYLPGDGETDYLPFAQSVAPLHFRGVVALSPNASLSPYADMDYFSLVSAAYDKCCAVQRQIKRIEGVI